MTIRKSNPQPRHLASLHEKGWSLRSAAAELGVDFGHLRRVLTGERASRRLTAAVRNLPRKSSSPAKP